MNDRNDPSTALIFGTLAAVAPDIDDELDDLDPDIDLWVELQLDSMDHLAVMTKLAAALGREIPETDYPRLLSIRQLREYAAR